MGNRHKLYKLPKPIIYTGSEPINYTLEPVNYTIVWNLLAIQMLKPLKYTTKTHKLYKIDGQNP